MKIIEKIENIKRQKKVFLDVRGENLREIPLQIKELDFLMVIDLRDNEISNLEPLVFLPNLTVLIIDGNQVVDISPLRHLTNLTNLSIRNNQISDISFLERLTNLTNLDISNNQIANISFLERVTNLTNLDISNNQIVDISFLERVTNLTNLVITNNQVTDISFLERLTNLTNLDISNNQITDISFLERLTNLTNLDISNNQITDISSLRYLTHLTNLNLNNNGIENLSALIHLDKLTVLDLDQNSISYPPIEIAYQGIRAVKEYFRELDKGTTFLNEAKLIVVGDGGVGKTSLVNKLSRDDTFLPKTGSTHGIEISSLKLKNKIKLNIWDFGGQEIYYSTHQFFLTNRSIYLFVFDSRRESNSLNYWLNVINIFSGNSPVILVLNKIDEFNRDIPFHMLREQFSQIISYQKVSCLTNQGISELKELIEQTASNLEHLKSPIPSSWLAVKEKLQELRSNGYKYINYNEFENICIENNVEPNSINTLSSFLHDLGIILHFANSLSLQNSIFLNYNFITNAIYAVINDSSIKDKNGAFNLMDLNRIWSDSSLKLKSNELIELMIRFELCFKVTDNQFYIPQLFPADISKNIKWESDFSEAKFEFRYPFLPFGILTRFIVKMHHLIYKEQYWKHGVVLEWESTKALITESVLERKIQIKINGGQQREFFNILRNGFNEIHLSYNNLVVEEFIPCNCSECSSIKNPEFYNFKILKKYMEKSKKYILCPQSFEDVQIEGLLGDGDALTGDGINFLDQILKDRGFDIPTTKNKDKNE